MTTDPGYTDITGTSRIERWLPARWLPFARLARLDRPIGTWLLLFPCWWSLALAIPVANPVVADSMPWATALWFGILCGIGAIVMRGAGCTLNDIIDRDIDAQVERTRTRPLPSGTVSLSGAVLFLFAQLLAGLLVLAQFSHETMVIGAASLLLVAPYPLMKRITWWPQLFLGLAFNWGALLGYVALTGTLDWPAVWLYLGGIAWTIGYDTIYAFQDRADDELVGVKSTARLFGERGRPLVGLFYALALAGWSAAFWLATGSVIAVLLMIIAVGGQFAWQLMRWQSADPADCLRLFKSNGWAGWLMLAACIVAAMLAPPMR